MKQATPTREYMISFAQFYQDNLEDLVEFKQVPGSGQQKLYQYASKVSIVTISEANILLYR